MAKKKEAKFAYQEIKEGDVVEFSKNDPRFRFGVVAGGFGTDPKSLGSKIFGSFGATPEEAMENYRKSLARKEQQIKELKEKGSITIDITKGVDYEGYTRTQPCRIVGHVDPKTGQPATERGEEK